MVLTRAAAARLAASEDDERAPACSVDPTAAPSTVPVILKGRRSRKADTQAAKSIVQEEREAGHTDGLQNGLDPLDDEMQRFCAEVEITACSNKGCNDNKAGPAQNANQVCLDRLETHENTRSRRVGTRGRAANTGKVDASTGALRSASQASSSENDCLAEDAPKSQPVCIDKSCISAEPFLYRKVTKTEVPGASLSKDAAPAASQSGTGLEDGERSKAVPLVPTTKLALSRAERAARAKILKEALVNVDEKQRKWQNFAKGKVQPAPREGQENLAAPSEDGEQCGEGRPSPEGWVFEKKVAFSFKPKSASPGTKGSRGITHSPSKPPAATLQEAPASPGVANATIDQGNKQSAEVSVPTQAVMQTPLPNPRPTLALNTPAIEAQARSGNPVLDLRFLFPKATPPEPSTPLNVSSSAAFPIQISPGDESAGTSLHPTGVPLASDNSSGVANPGEATEGCSMPAPNTAGFASPFSVESASPALKEILRAAHSFVANRTATGSSPSPLNPNLNPNPNPRSKLKARRESYSDVFASPTLVNIFKGARTTAAQKADVVGTERAQTELERITAAAKEYASSRAQLAVAGSPLGVLCQKETELALSFAEKLQLADPTSVICSSSNGGGPSDTKQLQPAPSNEAWEHLLPAENGGQAVRYFDGRTVQVRSGVPANQVLPPVPNSPKEKGATVYVVVDTNCYLSVSDMPAVRRIYEAAQSVAGGQRRYEWTGTERVVIVVPNAVIRELDGLKLNPNTTNMARAAMRFLKDGCKAQPRSVELAGPEKAVQVEPIKNGPPEFSGADDAILGCCLYMDRYEGEGVLLTNDVALQLKAMMYGLEATSASEFLSQRLRRLDQPVNNWAAQMRQVVAMRESGFSGVMAPQRSFVH